MGRVRVDHCDVEESRGGSGTHDRCMIVGIFEEGVVFGWALEQCCKGVCTQEKWLYASETGYMRWEAGCMRLKSVAKACLHGTRGYMRQKRRCLRCKSVRLGSKGGLRGVKAGKAIRSRGKDVFLAL
jgi:hypothetical protein